MNKYLLIFGVFLIQITVHGQLSLDVSKDYLEINQGDAFPDQHISFASKPPRYDSVLFSRGLHIKNQKHNFFTKTISYTGNNGGPVLGIHGQGSVFELKGNWYGDGTLTHSNLLLTNGGKFIIDTNAVVDLIMADNYFTRQMWIWGDGTGIFEIEHGFVADYTNNATNPVGMGSLRFNNMILITHDGKGIPLGKRPLGIDSSAVNSHLVFEGGPSTWKVLSHDQVFNGGIWMKWADLTLETQENLLLTGVKAVWKDYTNIGGIVIGSCDGHAVESTCCNTRHSLIKTGPAAFILDCDMAFDIGSRMLVKEGTVEFRQDATQTAENKYEISTSCLEQSPITTPNLFIEAEGGIISINTPLVRIDSLHMNQNAGLQIGLYNQLKANYMHVNGKLEVVLPEGAELLPGDTFNILSTSKIAGSFDEIIFNPPQKSEEWDLRQLSPKGLIAYKGIKPSNIIEETRFTTIFRVFSSEHGFVVKSNTVYPGMQILLFDAMGRKILQEPITSSYQTISAQNLKKGVYLYQIIGNGIKLSGGKVLR